MQYQDHRCSAWSVANIRVGFVGLGKLGLPSALAIESKGHTVTGYDIDPRVAGYVQDRRIPYIEAGVHDLLQKTRLKVLPLDRRATRL